MILIVLAALGIPVWLLIGAVAASLWSRRSFRRSPGVFAVRWRTVHQPAAATSRWSRRNAYARWVHDVLLVHQGLALIRNQAWPVANVSLPPTGSVAVTGLGTDTPVVVRFCLDGGQLVEVAAAPADVPALLGPFDVRGRRPMQIALPVDWHCPSHPKPGGAVPPGPEKAGSHE